MEFNDLQRTLFILECFQVISDKTDFLDDFLQFRSLCCAQARSIWSLDRQANIGAAKPVWVRLIALNTRQSKRWRPMKTKQKTKSVCRVSSVDFHYKKTEKERSKETQRDQKGPKSPSKNAQCLGNADEVWKNKLQVSQNDCGVFSFHVKKFIEQNTNKKPN